MMVRFVMSIWLVVGNSKQEILIQVAKLQKILEMRAESLNQIYYVLQHIKGLEAYC